MLGEFGDDPHRYADARARKNYAGASPITRASGKKKVVLARYARNDRLADALHQQAFCAQLTLRGIGAKAVVAILHHHALAAASEDERETLRTRLADEHERPPGVWAGRWRSAWSTRSSSRPRSAAGCWRRWPPHPPAAAHTAIYHFDRPSFACSQYSSGLTRLTVILTRPGTGAARKSDRPCNIYP